MKMKDAIKKILVINLAFIGDTILSTPVTRALKEAWPAASVAVMTIPAAAAVVEMNPYVDKVLVYDKKGRHKGLGGMWKMAKLLRAEQFDLAVCMNFAVRGAAVAWLAGIKYRVGYDAQHAGWFLTHVSSHVREKLQHETSNHLMVLKSLGITTEDTSLVFHLDDKARQTLAEKVKLPVNQPIVIVCPFGSYARKSLCEEKYIEIITKVQDKAVVYLIGGTKEKKQLESIAKAAGLSMDQVLAGKLELGELAVLISQARAMLSVDTGPMHMAQAVGTPVAALFGPTDPVVWGPRGERDILFYRKTKCSPCWGKGECSGNDCMEQFSADEIAAGIKKILAG
jgi:lipopolysaccharide heptosyltransferase II